MAKVTFQSDYQYERYLKDLNPNSHLGEKIRVAIFGLGRIGAIHLRNLSRDPQVRVAYCVEDDSQRRDAAHRSNPLPSDVVFLSVGNQDIVFQDSKVAAIVICTPTYTHEELVIRALTHGKAVFCEKPLSLNEDGNSRCFYTQKQTSKPLFVAFNRRFDPGFRSLKQRLDSGEIGSLQMIKTCSRDSPKPSLDYLKTSGGIFHDCAVHDLDLVCWAAGEWPKSVSATAHAYCQDIDSLGDFDTVSIQLKFPSGIIGIIDLSRHAVYGYDQRVEMLGSRGMLTCGSQRPTATVSHGPEGSTSLPILYSFASRYQEAYVAEMEHFLDVVRGVAKSEIPLSSVLAVSRLASACEESARKGTVVHLTWDQSE